MKTVAVTKIGNLRDPDPEKRGRIEVIDFPRQELGPEDVRIAVAYSSICGSDPHVAEGVFHSEVPFGLGHEVSGIVAELGAEAGLTGLKVGDRVACNFLKFCGACRECLDGRQQFCTNLRSKYRRPGMAEEVVWHVSQVYRIPDALPLEKACLLEPTSIAVRIADKARIRVGDRVAICGGGPIGQLAMQILRLDGATDLTLIEPIEARRELALAHGADHVIDPITEDQQARASQITDGRGFDLVVDASGSTRAAPGVLELAANGGMVMYAAMYPNDFNLPLNLASHLYQRELTVTGVFVAPYTFPRAMQLLSRLNLDAFTEAIFALDDAPQAFETHLSGAYAKVIIACGATDTSTAGHPAPNIMEGHRS